MTFPCSPPAGGRLLDYNTDMGWFVYAIFNYESHKIYIGQTNNIERRVQEHNQKRGKHFTAQIYGNWELIYREEVQSKKEALRREKQLKSYQGREFIKKLIIPL